LLSRNGYYQQYMPCLAGEGSSQGCVSGLIQVRSDNGTHFCPGTQWPCEVYSSGARRDAETIQHAA